MSIKVTMYRVVLAGPRDVDNDIRKIKKEIRSLTDTYIRKKIGYLHYDWKMSAPNVHIEGPQGVIDQDMKINQSDIFICIFKKRYGTPTMNSKSGTEHELNDAYESWRTKKHPQIKMYFKKINDKESSILKDEEKKQYENMLKLKKRMKDKGLYAQYSTLTDLSTQVRDHLTAYLLSKLPKTKYKKKKSKVTKSPESKKKKSIIPKSLVSKIKKVEIGKVGFANNITENTIENFFTFQKQPDDDHHFEELDFIKYNYEIYIKPIKTGYWRCGFKFSGNRDFSVDRYASGYPLIHLLHNITSEDENILRLMYYDNLSRKAIDLEPIFTDYSNQEIKVCLTPKSGIINIDFSIDKLSLHNFNIGNYKFSQFFCWWDREPNIPIKAKVFKISH